MKGRAHAEASSSHSLHPLRSPLHDMAFGNLRDLVVKTVLSKDGTEIHAEAIGNPSNPHVVFVHGIDVCSHPAAGLCSLARTGMACTSAAFDPVFSLPEVQAQIYAVSSPSRRRTYF
jgi:hypothetical protein